MAQIPVDSAVEKIDSLLYTIEGDERAIQAIKNKPIHPNDYLGVGTPSWQL